MSFSQKVPASVCGFKFESFIYLNTQVMHFPNLHASHLCTCRKVTIRWKVVISYKP